MLFAICDSRFKIQDSFKIVLFSLFLLSNNLFGAFVGNNLCTGNEWDRCCNGREGGGGRFDPLNCDCTCDNNGGGGNAKICNNLQACLIENPNLYSLSSDECPKDCEHIKGCKGCFMKCSGEYSRGHQPSCYKQFYDNCDITNGSGHKMCTEYENEKKKICEACEVVSCNAGYYKDGNRCTQCPSNYPKSDEGADSKNKCYKEDAWTEWENVHTGHGKVRFYCSKVFHDNSCEGHRMDLTADQRTQVNCDTGYYYKYEDEKYKCLICPAGSYCKDSKKIECETGQYQDKEGKTVCATCPKGQYQDKGGQKECKPCLVGNYLIFPDANKENTATYNGNETKCTILLFKTSNTEYLYYTNYAGLTINKCQGATQCAPCPKGFYCPEKTICPIPCPRREYSEGGKAECAKCDENQYDNWAENFEPKSTRYDPDKNKCTYKLIEGGNNNNNNNIELDNFTYEFHQKDGDKPVLAINQQGKTRDEQNKTIATTRDGSNCKNCPYGAKGDGSKCIFNNKTTTTTGEDIAGTFSIECEGDAPYELNLLNYYETEK